MGKVPKEKEFTKAQLVKRVKTYRFMLSIIFGIQHFRRKRVGKEMFLDTDRGKVRVLAYNLDNPSKLPLFVDIHGSGFVMADAEMDDPFMRNIAEKANVKILSVDYSLAPEEPFPKALNECYDVVKYAKEHASEFGIDPENIAVGGHSAGGNLAAAICLMEEEKKILGLKCVILDYPPLDIATDPYLKPTPKKSIPPSMARFFNACYCTKEEAKNPLVSPIFATTEQLKSFPPTLIITASQDSLCKEGEDFRDKLEAAGVKVDHKRFEAVHGFTLSNSPAAKEAWQMMIDYLSKYLHKS